MAMVIKVVSKDQHKDSITEEMQYTLCLGLFDNSVTPHKQVNANFKQTPTLTEALAGITEYGALYCNSLNSTLSATVDITCVDDNGEETTKSATLQSIIGKGAGNAI